uniref:Uncharacterized protein n=1 Tax=Rhodnius prolixus TaxID=13249 RepID=T1HNS4_RHOPR
MAFNRKREACPMEFGRRRLDRGVTDGRESGNPEKSMKSCSKWRPPLEMHRHALSCQLPLTAKEIVSALTELQTSNDGNTTTSTLSFVASKDDDGKNLSCRAENPITSSEVLQDYWTLHIHFLFEMFITPLCVYKFFYLIKAVPHQKTGDGSFEVILT